MTKCGCGHDARTHNRRECLGLTKTDSGQPYCCICNKSRAEVELQEARAIINQQALCLSILEQTATNQELIICLQALAKRTSDFLEGGEQ